MRILYLASSPGWDGPEIHLLKEATSLLRRGHAVSLAAYLGKGKIPHDIATSPIPLHLLSRWPLIRAWQLRRIIQRNSSDIIIVNSTETTRWAIGARVTAKKLVRSEYYNINYHEDAAGRKALRQAGTLLANGKTVAENLTPFFDSAHQQLSIIPTGVDLGYFVAQSNFDLRTELELSPTTYLIGQVSGLKPWKGHLILLQALRRLLNEGVDARVVIAGAGPMQPWIEEEIKHQNLHGHVHLLGNRADIPSLLSALDVVVVPSTGQEGIPQGILEAQACSRCVVASSIGGIPEVIQDGVTGFLVEPNAPVELAGTLRLLCDQAALRERIGRTARARIESDYSSDEIAKRLEKTLSQV
jgi:glycosyltransferase involved in cell wall biosynthesis